MDSRIRNFSIIAHIDHGKSTLADRLLELSGVAVNSGQILDSMDLERERGITIKSSAIRLDVHQDDQTYIFNLIDTPGHVDFTYEVSRALASCEGAILVVDASQGIQAQTYSNIFLAQQNNLVIIPVINKIDLPQSDIAGTISQIKTDLDIQSEPLLVSAKTGMGVEQIIGRIIQDIPAAENLIDEPFRALIFDSHYNTYRGVVMMVRVVEGQIAVGDKITMMSTGHSFEIEEVGHNGLIPQPKTRLSAGEVGYIMAQIKYASEVRIGDTVTSTTRPTKQALPGYKVVKPMVFAGLYPTDAIGYDKMRAGMEKFQLSDAAFVFEPESSAALGLGFRCGFLGLLHMDIVTERMRQEWGMDLIATAPTVKYQLVLTDGSEMEIDNPANWPDEGRISSAKEPYARVTFFTPEEYLGPVMDLATKRRGVFLDMEYLDLKRIILHYDLPMAEIVTDFFDKLKSRTRGYGSMDYEFSDYRNADLAKIQILVNGDLVDSLSLICHTESAYTRARYLVDRLKETIHRQQYQVAIQAKVKGRIIARNDISALKKNVTAKCYGGDISRKRKLLERQKEGKKRMKMLGKVSIPQEAFMAVLSVED